MPARCSRCSTRPGIRFCSICSPTATSPGQGHRRRVAQAVTDESRIRTVQQTIAAADRTQPAEHPDPHRARAGGSRSCVRGRGQRAGLMTADYSQIEMRIMARLSSEGRRYGEDLQADLMRGRSACPSTSRNCGAGSKASTNWLPRVEHFGLSRHDENPPRKPTSRYGRVFRPVRRVRDYLRAVVERARRTARRCWAVAATCLTGQQQPSELRENFRSARRR